MDRVNTYTSYISIQSWLCFLCHQILHIPPVVRNRLAQGFFEVPHFQWLKSNGVQGDLKQQIWSEFRYSSCISPGGLNIDFSPFTDILSMLTWKKYSKSFEAGSRLVTFSSSAFIESCKR